MNRKTFSASVKAKAVLEAIRGEKTLNEIGLAYGVHPTQLGQWRKQALEGLPDIFANGRSKRHKNEEVERDRLYQQIGRLQVELDWLKKKIGVSN
jgi:transposase